MIESGSKRRLRDRKYLALFVTLLCLLALQSFSLSFGIGAILSDLFITVVIVAICHVVFEGARARILTWAVASAVLFVQWVYYILPRQNLHLLEISQHLLIAGFLGFALTIILKDMFQKRAGGGDHIFGAMSGYIIGGAAWAQLNAMAYLLAPGAYSFGRDLSEQLADRHARAALFTYYSFTQLFTLGDADVTPMEAPATTLSMLEVLYGVFYLAAVLSQFVGRRQEPV